MQEQQARLVPSMLAPREGFYPRIGLDGTRLTSVSVEDFTFRRRVLRMCLGAGIPVNVLGRVCSALEDMSKKSLEGATAIVALVATST